MRIRLFVAGIILHLISATAAGTGNASRTTADSQDLLFDLPLCAQECFDPLNCALETSACYCTDEALLSFETCAWSSCTVRQLFVAKKTHRSSCGIEERSYSWKLSSSLWTLFALAVAAVSLRFVARSPYSGGVGYGWDDWVILACLVPVLAYDVLLGLGANDGLGKDIWTLSPPHIDSILRYLWIAIFAYTAILVGVQVSVILFYVRIFGDTHRKFRTICLSVMALCITSGLAACIGSLLYCSRIALFWQIWDEEHEGTCRSAHTQVYTMAGINIFLDLVILTLPISKLKDLNVSMARKIGLGATLLVGMVATCASIVRLRYLIVWGNTMNPTWDYNHVAISSSYECHLSVICACMPSMAGLWKRFCTRQKVSELQNSRSTPHPASLSKEQLCHGAEGVPKRQRASSVRVATSLAEFLAIEDGRSTSDLELTQRGIDHANEEIARIKALG